MKINNYVWEDNFYNLIEEMEFIDSNILKDIRGEKYEREN